ncbi:hypothetical protein BD309DRAFT_388324 [Dichomitus squalens]|uniref:Uncharacterized protein n=1 Tax=Dichomitus squalens TaxID=114155 RepID=A0A4Q9P996_9APHY|nr:hypothetical protein BD309DRAFT_388324 [Dichomitus squalens]TBU62991.1 hypothetical protein BD310DRAFT_662953 [Dichomitus squalens]
MAVIVFSPEAVCTCTLYPFPPRLRRNSEGLHLSPRNVCDTLGAAQFRRRRRLRSGSHEPVFIRHASHATSYLNIVAGNRDAQRMACASFESRPCDATGSVALRALFYLPPCFELGLPCPFSPFANPPLSCSSALAGRSLLPRPNRQPLRCPRRPWGGEVLARSAHTKHALRHPAPILVHICPEWYYNLPLIKAIARRVWLQGLRDRLFGMQPYSAVRCQPSQAPVRSSR